MLKHILFFIFIAFVSNIHAHELKGTIRDAETKLPVEGIAVYNKTTGGYAYSNASGVYHLEDVSLKDTIIFQGLGYEKQSFVIDENLLDGTLDVFLVDDAVLLNQVVILSEVNSLSSIVNVDVQNIPVKSSQEILRKVPGLIIGQHAGGGKAEQIFLRGFDVDHGTDIAISVDGLPVNLPSHAHGQGYSDLHFVIPETINNIDFGKGPYYADKGNFNTAGYIELKTKKTIDKNHIAVEGGQFNTLRAVGLLNIFEKENSSFYVGSELVLTDGVFESPQDFNRLNLMGRYHYNNYENEEFTATLSHFQSKWSASGQIPQRAVDQGLITRFGAIDNTEGGITGRSNLLINHRKQLSEHEEIKSKAFISRYDFELYSNFTFFLEDPVNGDQIRQKENRTIYGAETVYKREFHLDDHDASLKFKAGIGFRYDDNNDVELSRTRNRSETLERLAFGDVDEINGYGFLNATYKEDDWTFNSGLRIDYFKFGYTDFLSATLDSRSENDVVISPKLNIIYTPSSNVQVFTKAGFGYHSNDSRVVTANTGEDTLPTAFGLDVGTILKPTENLVINAALWSLSLQQEFVYVGDAGVVEPSGKSQRFGVDFGLRYQFTKWLYGNADINYTYARSTEAPSGQDFIPLAPDLTSSGSLSFKDVGKFSGGLGYRYVKDRPANEDNSIVAEGYFVTDLTVNYSFSKKVSFGIIVENLLNTEWNETQFATETRLQNEVNSVEEITFTPGTPFFLRAKLTISF